MASQLTPESLQLTSAALLMFFCISASTSDLLVLVPVSLGRLGLYDFSVMQARMLRSICYMCLWLTQTGCKRDGHLFQRRSYSRVYACNTCSGVYGQLAVLQSYLRSCSSCCYSRLYGRYSRLYSV